MSGWPCEHCGAERGSPSRGCAAEHVIKQTRLAHYWVSTVRERAYHAERMGYAFETAVFACDGEKIDTSDWLESEGDDTEAEALATHERLCSEYRERGAA